MIRVISGISEKSVPKVGDLRVWHIPQVPGKPFHVKVETIAEAKAVLSILAQYDLFQLKHRIKGDYSNVAGLEIYEADAGEGHPGWCTWYNHDGYGIDEIDENGILLDSSDFTPEEDSAEIDHDDPVNQR
jgi:hypothetical protein